MPKRTSDGDPSSTGSAPREQSGAGGGHPLENLDQVIHSPGRLMIVTHLYVVEAADAVFLQNMTNLSWGNLSSHLRKLEEAGYVTIEKSFSGRKPRTVIALTESGREALRDYRAAILRSLESIEA